MKTLIQDFVSKKRPRPALPEGECEDRDNEWRVVIKMEMMSGGDEGRC